MTADLLVRYLAGDATPREAEAVEHWADADPEHARTLAALRQVLGPEPHLVGQPDVDAAWRALESRLSTSTPPITIVREWPPARRPRFPLAGAAAAALLVAAGGAWWIATSRPAPRPVAEAHGPVVTTPRGQRLSLRLSDGTLVTLAPGTTLRLSPRYGARDRVVQLDGEGAFTVTHDSTRPFIVRAAQAETRDLGTRFVVRAYAGEPAAHVAVADGRVAVTAGPGAQRLVLGRSEVARIAKGGEPERVPGAALEPYFGWVDGRLAFHDAPLEDAAAELARWYDVEVRLGSDSIRTLPLTASFTEARPAEALRLVAAILDLKLSHAGRTFTLSPR